MLKKTNEKSEHPSMLPPEFLHWFDGQGWKPRPHQTNLLNLARSGCSVLLIAPTGAGKTLAGFLPSLVDIADGRKVRRSGDRRPGLHTLYISPLKALAVDIARNLERPVKEIGLRVQIETRTGDTPAHKRLRQKHAPPDILLTTPEQVALLLASAQADRLFGSLQTVILDELHSLVTSKRGDLLSLGLARLRSFAPNFNCIGLSATVSDPDSLRAFLLPQQGNLTGSSRQLAELVEVRDGTEPDIVILDSAEHIPWSGHSARYAFAELYQLILDHKMSLLFVNTRSQAEVLFQEIWQINEKNLPIALHHGSLDAGKRRKVESAMAGGKLRAVICTSSLDLGIDWGDIDLVINIGAPKGASRLAQRIGRANHRMDEPSKAVLVPANRFEVLECRAALEASRAGIQDTPEIRTGALDVLAQHILGTACYEPFDSDKLYAEAASALPYAALKRSTFNRVVDFVATGGYALKTYDRYARLKKNREGLWRIANPKVAQQYRLNVGTIIEEPMLKVRLVRSREQGRKTPVGRGGRLLGQVEEWFVESLSPGDTFVFGGEIVSLEMIKENEAYVSKTFNETPKIPSYQGGRFPLSTYLAKRVRRMLADSREWNNLPEPVSEWLEIQRDQSRLPKADALLIETFPRSRHNFLVCYPFEGRLAHQTLGMLLTRRLERMRTRPVGFVANDYALAVWGLGDFSELVQSGSLDLAELFDEDMLGDDLDAWLAESNLMKRSFRACATIAGLIEKRYPGMEKTGRQMTVSSDLIYDVLRSHEPDHILLEATWLDAATGLLDIERLGGFLKRIRGNLEHVALERVSPLAVPVMLEIGREPIFGEAQDVLLAEAEAELIREALG